MPCNRIAAPAALVLAALPLPALAQAPAPCDVAVWTTADYSADNLGMMAGGLLDAMTRTADRPAINSKQAIEHMLPPAVLFEQIAGSRLPAILGREVNFVHVEKSREESKVDRKRTGRSTASTNPCYIEVYLFMVYYQAAAFHGERIISYYVFRDFRGAKPVKSSTYDNGQMKHFSRQSVEGATILARQAIREVFETLTAKKFGRR
jgi:hypothetical protein